MQASFEPVCCELRSQIKVLQSEIFYKLAPVQVRMKKYCFKRSDESKSSFSFLLNTCNECRFGSYYQTCLACGRRSPDSEQGHDSMHDCDEPNLVHNFEKQEEDEVSHSDSLHDLHDPNFTQPSQINTGETLQDCIDFDELLNDVHSTAASAQLLRYSLSGSSEPTP